MFVMIVTTISRLTQLSQNLLPTSVLCAYSLLIATPKSLQIIHAPEIQPYARQDDNLTKIRAEYNV